MQLWDEEGIMEDGVIPLGVRLHVDSNAANACGKDGAVVS
jgi:hypothetical protein